MHMARFAPVLSATSSIVISWIMALASRCVAWCAGGSGGSGLRGALDDAQQAPALLRRDRPGLHHLDDVADAGLVVLVVHVELRPLADVLLVERVTDLAAHLDHERLLHLVRGDLAADDAAVTPRGRAAATLLRAGFGSAHR